MLVSKIIFLSLDSTTVNPNPIIATIDEVTKEDLGRNESKSKPSHKESVASNVNDFTFIGKSHMSDKNGFYYVKYGTPYKSTTYWRCLSHVKNKKSCTASVKQTNDEITFFNGTHTHEPEPGLLRNTSGSKSVKKAQDMPLRKSQRSRQQQQYYGVSSNPEPVLVKNQSGEHIPTIEDLSRLQHPPEENTAPSLAPINAIVPPKSPDFVEEQEENHQRVFKALRADKNAEEEVGSIHKDISDSLSEPIKDAKGMQLRRSLRRRQQQEFYGGSSNPEAEPMLVQNESGERISTIEDQSRLKEIEQPRSPNFVEEQDGLISTGM